MAVVFAAVLFIASLQVGAEEDYSVLSYAIANKIIVIDPGHGGIDPGAVGRNGTLEKDVNLEISRRLATYLGQAGAVVVMTRETDNDLADSGFEGSLIERKRQDLARRAAKAQEVKADMFISIHCNADFSPRWSGAQVFYCPTSEESRHIAISIQQELRRILGNTNREAKPAVYFITEKTSMPAVILEVGFLSNPQEEFLLADKAYQARLAYAIFSGIVKYHVEEAGE
ncbi:N-acetylmuramoyl-L-alanine amidase CwlD [Syntrophothermus lipocalidus]|uniref:N-acetylmuramoyl-L-alanine amidase CwlD n=1 Tax=Syntrophothermus lipocalidus (strain DSM 12680 / TGB-C1) TaxID=643648 RepID=D7CJI6_SYNLT|nr:N-acetylmuramoyl-L-alanine amidase CwlD [Syntrophothermus lipocalidus]ADI02941.1 N-acetylmuramoyl-L-alanine amidase CwlD [Syntrophothermus lipocalidus DSM 12680]